MERRSFIKQVFTVAASGVIAPSLMSSRLTTAAENKKSITILHTNDTHSNIDPFPQNHEKFAGRGGVEARYRLIQEIRAKEKQVLLLDAGDIFQGTPYFNRYGGVLEMKVMQKMGYDAATMGNHDFDGGLDGFFKAKAHAEFPFICSNYDFSNTLLEGQTRRTLILNKGALKIGIFGLGVELNGLVPKNKFAETRYLNPIEIAQDCELELKRAGCDMIICLSHLGYSYADKRISDLELARLTKYVHLIIGGHTHTFLDKPTEVLNQRESIVLVNQVGWAGLNLGQLEFTFDRTVCAKSSSLKI